LNHVAMGRFLATMFDPQSDENTRAKYGLWVRKGASAVYSDELYDFDIVFAFPAPKIELKYLRITNQAQKSASTDIVNQKTQNDMKQAVRGNVRGASH